MYSIEAPRVLLQLTSVVFKCSDNRVSHRNHTKNYFLFGEVGGGGGGGGEQRNPSLNTRLNAISQMRLIRILLTE